MSPSTAKCFALFQGLKHKHHIKWVCESQYHKCQPFVMQCFKMPINFVHSLVPGDHTMGAVCTCLDIRQEARPLLDVSVGKLKL